MIARYARKQPVKTTRHTELAALVHAFAQERQQAGAYLSSAITADILPLVQRLERKCPQCRAQLRLLTRRLRRLLSGVPSEMQEQTPGLTPREAEVCRLLRDGCTSKEIAGMLHIDIVTVYAHRDAIRAKLGLRGTRGNLCRHLAAP